MQIGLRQGLVNAALIGPKGATTLQHQCDPLERWAFSRDVGLAQRRLAVRHHSPPELTARVAPPQPLLRSILGNMIGDIELAGGPISALGHKRTFHSVSVMSALPLKADTCSALAHVC